MFTNTLRLCTNRVKRQIVNDLTRQISKTTSVTNSGVNISLRQTQKEGDGQFKKLPKLKKNHR